MPGICCYGNQDPGSLQYRKCGSFPWRLTSAPKRRGAISGLTRRLSAGAPMEAINFKHLRITRATSGFSFAWKQSEVIEPLAAAIPDLKKGIELLLVAPKDPLLTKTLIEFTLWAEENNWDYETLCEESDFDGEISAEP